MVENDYVEIPPTADMRWNAVLKKEVPVQKVKPPTMWPCLECGKQTRSHLFEDGVVLCHGCYEKKSKEGQDEFARKHSRDRFADGRAGGAEEHSNNPGKAQEPEMQG